MFVFLSNFNVCMLKQLMSFKIQIDFVKIIFEFLFYEWFVKKLKTFDFIDWKIFYTNFDQTHNNM